MGILVQKFGGTSVASYEKMKEVCKIIEAHKEKYKNIAVVVSAMGRKGAPYATDTLISMCTNINDRPTKRELDMIMSCGEIISGTILATMLDSMGIPATFLTGTQAGIITTKAFSNAKIKKINPKKIQRELADGKVVIIAGFQGMNEKMDITTLGRGGSDTTALALAAALKAKNCYIFSDVDGVYTTDPKKVKDAKKLSALSYNEMMEISSEGAKVLHNRCVEIGDKFKEGQIYVPEMLIAAKAMQAGLKVLAPSLKAEGVEPIGKAVIGTVKGDLHDIGKNLVKMMMDGAGIEMVDLGVDVPEEKFVEKAEEIGADIVCLSALLTTTMPAIETTIKAFEEKGIKDKYILTSRGTVKVKDLFCNGMASSIIGCQDISVKLIKNKIKEMVDLENKKKPLADQAICDLLNKDQINISRRTVAKYREELGIKSSSKRKRI